jgi:hypothetical protein
MSEYSIQEIEPEGFRELNYREADGISVALLWCGEDDSLTVVVEDLKEETSFEVPANRQNMQDVFEHPYAYKASGELAVTGALRQAA